MTTDQEFRQWAKNHPNFMTPHIITVLEKGDDVIEVSSGKGFEHEPIFGVTVAHRTSEGFKTGDTRSKMFFSKSEALRYANNLKKVM